VCCKLEEGKPLIMDIVFDWSVSPLVERRTPTEVLRTTAARLRADFDYGEHRIVLHNDAAFGGAQGADLCATLGVEAICSTANPQVHRLLSLLGPRLQANQYFYFSEPRGAYRLQYIVRKIKCKPNPADTVSGVNTVVQGKQLRLLVNTSTSDIGLDILANLPLPQQLSDEDARPLLSLPRHSLVGLARIISARSQAGRLPAGPPAENWTATRLVALIAGRPLAEIEKIFPRPALKKRTPQRTQLQEELDVALLPIAAGLANVATEKAETNTCGVPLCDRQYNVLLAAPPGWVFCPTCYRLAICPAHAARWMDRFIAMHVEGCDTWAELEATTTGLNDQKKALLADFDAKCALADSAYGRRLSAMTRQQLHQEALRLGLINNTSSLKKPELKTKLARLDSVSQMSLDQIVLESFGEVHDTRRAGVPGLWKQYQEGFNYVDLSNKEFYKIKWPYRVTSDAQLFTWFSTNLVLLQAHRYFSLTKQAPGPPLRLIPFIKQALDAFFEREDPNK
jgi:hypothetical protein